MAVRKHKLTIAVPVYNEEPYIERALLSCVKQDAEIWVYDNASTDRTSEIVTALAKKHKNIKYYRQGKNIGSFLNWQEPLFKCTTPYFMWLGAHDGMSSNYVAALTDQLDNSDAILAFGSTQLIDEQDNLLKTNKFDFTDLLLSPKPLDRVETIAAYLKDCFMLHGIYRTKEIQEAWNPDVCFANDVVILTKIAAQGKIAYIPDAYIWCRDFARTRDKTSKKINLRRARDIVHSLATPMEITFMPAVKKQIAIAKSVAKKTDQKQIDRLAEAAKWRMLERHQLKGGLRRWRTIAIGSILLLLGTLAFMLLA